jgi:hypothetical protein
MRRRRRAARAENKLCKRRHNSERTSGSDKESRVIMVGEKRFFVVRRLIAFEPYWPTPCFPIPALVVIGGSRKTANQWAPIWRRGPKFAGYGWTPFFPPELPSSAPSCHWLSERSILIGACLAHADRTRERTWSEPLSYLASFLG